MKNKGELIGIFGGTFSPVHNGHVRAAEAFMQQEKLSRLYIIPANVPPHKSIPDTDNPQARLEMTRLAFGDMPGYGYNIVVSDYEIARGGSSKTVFTLEHFRMLSENIALLCGTDMFLSLEKWYRYEDIFRYADIVYIRREKEADITREIERATLRYRELYTARVRSVESEPVIISSSELRQRLSANEDCSEFIPEKVLRYIKDNKLYDRYKPEG